jgi:hypothetical protein
MSTLSRTMYAGLLTVISNYVPGQLWTSSSNNGKHAIVTPISPTSGIKGLSRPGWLPHFLCGTYSVFSIALQATFGYLSSLFVAHLARITSTCSLSNDNICSPPQWITNSQPSYRPLMNSLKTSIAYSHPVYGCHHPNSLFLPSTRTPPTTRQISSASLHDIAHRTHGKSYSSIAF